MTWKVGGCGAVKRTMEAVMAAPLVRYVDTAYEADGRIVGDFGQVDDADVAAFGEAEGEVPPAADARVHELRRRACCPCM